MHCVSSFRHANRLMASQRRRPPVVQPMARDRAAPEMFNAPLPAQGPGAAGRGSGMEDMTSHDGFSIDRA
ncbi:protein of unknown function [Aminobacter niigataensis]|nr:protein of unknown function [Aminobacter niigataensis]